MIMPAAVNVLSGRIETCPRDGAAYLPSQGCRICDFDARYETEPLDFCADCGAGLDGRSFACGACLHAALLADALTSVARLTRPEEHPSPDAVTAFAREALAGSVDAEVADLTGQLVAL